MAILIIQHWPTGLPGRLALTLRDHGFKLDIRRPDMPPGKDHKPLPTDLDNVQGLISLGGPQNVCDADIKAHPWLAQELDLIRQAHRRELPVIGVCLGAQLIAHALGGSVAPMPKPEIGMHPVTINTTGQVEPVLAGIAWEHPQFHSHHWEVSKLPAGSALLASSKLCANQAFRVGLRTFGFQYHFELDREGIARHLASEKETLASMNLAVETALKHVDAQYEMFARLSDRLCVNLAMLLFPFQRRMSA